MMTVSQVSQITGCSVRTLRLYDKLGLLRPAGLTDAGYRLYDEKSLERLRQILLLRELEFPLKEIAFILDSADYDPQKALADQIVLLQAKRERLDRLLTFARAIQEKGVSLMDFSAFDKTQTEQYRREAAERWEHTDAWKQAQAQDSKKTPDIRAAEADGLMACFSRLGAMKHLSPADPAVQAEVRALRQYLTEHYYNCTEEIFRGLGEMYVGDERFTASIDKAGGEGTAAFVRDAIAVCCTH